MERMRFEHGNSAVQPAVSTQKVHPANPSSKVVTVEVCITMPVLLNTCVAQQRCAIASWYGLGTQGHKSDA